MIPTCRHEGRFSRLFRERYLRSLDDYRFFYDDFATYGDPAEADHAVYFVPGINGTAGQIRFVLPSLLRVFGRRLYVKSLHLPEFSSLRPTWMKYSLANVDRKLARIRADLEQLLARHERVIVIASSSGFYDFAAAAGHLPENVLRDRIHLIWGSCAPDQFKPSPWERVFYPLNGFEYDGHRWFAYPNHNLFRGFNPETSHSHQWHEGAQQRCFRKADLESRFRLGGLEWSYVSPGQLGAATRHVVRQIRGPLPCPTCALVATNDGYWQGRPIPVIERTIHRYLSDVSVTFKPASHLWVVTPTNVTEVLRHVKASTTTLSFSDSAPIAPPAESPASPRLRPAESGRFGAPLYPTFS
jgi:hypothetical protein